MVKSPSNYRALAMHLSEHAMNSNELRVAIWLHTKVAPTVEYSQQLQVVFTILRLRNCKTIYVYCVFCVISLPASY